MKSAKKAVYDLLIGDATLKALLETNAPFYDTNGTKTTANSIMPAGKATTSTKTPFITIQGGPRVKVDPLGFTYDEFFYIRCYNDIRKSYIEIDSVIERIEALLDEHNFSLADGSNVLTTLEDVDIEREDETLNLNFREARFRIRIIEE